MASKTKTATVAPPSYIEFEPYCEWRKEDKIETLVFHLPDFKKEQLRVQVNNLGVLKVSGERQETENRTKGCRFVKEAKLPQGCDINDIRAKFSGGHLYVSMPKKATAQIQQQQQQSKEEVLPPKAEKPNTPSSEIGKTATAYGSDQPKDDHMFGLGDALGRLQGQKKVNVGLGVAVAAIVAIGAYVVYSYGSSSSPPPSVEE